MEPAAEPISLKKEPYAFIVDFHGVGNYWKLFQNENQPTGALWCFAAKIWAIFLTLIKVWLISWTYAPLKSSSNSFSIWNLQHIIRFNDRKNWWFTVISGNTDLSLYAFCVLTVKNHSILFFTKDTWKTFSLNNGLWGTCAFVLTLWILCLCTCSCQDKNLNFEL